MSTTASTSEGSGGQVRPALLWPAGDCQVIDMPQWELTPSDPTDSRPDLVTTREGRESIKGRAVMYFGKGADRAPV